MIQVLDKYGNTSTDDGRVVIIDKFGNVKKPSSGKGSGTVTSILTASPIMGGPITSTGTIRISQSGGKSDGYLSATDWKIFNGKENTLTFNAPLTRAYGVISIPAASSSVNGYLTSTDWNTFNSKFNLPVLNNGGILFSNGTTILDDYEYFFWDDINNRLRIGADVTSTTNTKVTVNMGTIHGTYDGVSIEADCGNNPGITGVRFNLLNTSADASGFIRMVRAIGTTYLGMQISSQSRDGIAFLTDTVTATEKMRLTANGNLLLGTTSDNSSKLNVQGTITASSAIARGVSFTPTLIAAANNDVLVGLDIAPTFTNGSFTGVQNIPFRIISPSFETAQFLRNGSGSSRIIVGNTAGTLTTIMDANSTTGAAFGSATNTDVSFVTGQAAKLKIIHSTGNILIQNGGTFTDDGVNRLQISGSARITDGLTLTGILATPLVVERNTGANANIQFKNTNRSFFAGLTQFNSFAIGTTNSDLGTNAQLSIFPTTGNVVIQNGSTPIDTGFRLDVNGTTRLNGLQTFQGTTASDTAPLGAELATTATGTNWTGTSFATGYTHTIGSTVALVSTLAAVIGAFYQIEYTITGRTAGSITINYGGTVTSGITATGATGPMATATTALNIVPTTDFDGVLVLSIKPIGLSLATTSFTNSAGIVTNELRASSNNSNIFLGLNAGRRNTISTNNTFIGFTTGQNNTTGRTNTFIGSTAGLFNTTGNNNLFAGVAAGYSNTIGTGNTFIGGYGTGLSNTTANNNTSIGSGAGQHNTTGNNNVLVGVSSGRFISTGTTLATILTNSIMLGFDTRPLADNQSNQIVIGSAAVGLGSNTTVLGNSSTVTTAIYGNLLVGTTTTNGSKLNIQGTVTAASAIARGQYLAPTLVASANNDVLVGLDINPTFTNGAFTGVQNIALRLPNQSRIGTSANNSYNIYLASNEVTLNSPVHAGTIGFQFGSIFVGRFMGTTGNFVLQNGGTFTDVASSRLTINSTTQGVLLPRMTTAQVNAIVSPVQGLTVFNTDLDTLCFYTTSWQKVTSTTM